MNEFITWSLLGTYAGAVAVTAMVTQFLKPVSFLKKLDTQLLSFIIALLILETSSLFLYGWNPENALLCILNSVAVSLASNGTYDILHKTVTVAEKEKNNG
ncbi:MAG: hypothetical protein IJF27_02720 [Oscillospiraceae bacterium]|nr:hypothetical protein [Oscillospiraceae bacterium]MBQ3049187.1 hypothetical protein [Oscillospiraceae bacterium]MBQ9938796.1 hypothetical protein [Oscillospiraceae bacterium]